MRKSGPGGARCKLTATHLRELEAVLREKGGTVGLREDGLEILACAGFIGGKNAREHGVTLRQSLAQHPTDESQNARCVQLPEDGTHVLTRGSRQQIPRQCIRVTCQSGIESGAKMAQGGLDLRMHGCCAFRQVKLVRLIASQPIQDGVSGQIGHGRFLHRAERA